ncbi:MAG TPA: hypothetical protein VEQ61_00590 [Thermoleophilaceae bacterium]|nr:hypothetical protein [Thermoleophilaceae bacterium]
MNRSLHTLLLSLLVMACALPVTAGASPAGVIKDCAHDGKLDREYSNSDLRKARGRLPSDLDEYSDCREVIAAAITGGSGKAGRKGKGSGGAGPAGAALTPTELAARAADAQLLERITSEQAGKPPRIKVGDQVVEPGKGGLFDLSTASNDLPLPLLLTLIGLILLGALGTALALRGRVPALARIPGLSKISTPSVRLPRLRR